MGEYEEHHEEIPSQDPEEIGQMVIYSALNSLVFFASNLDLQDTLKKTS
ncbi:hypothetical protein [Pseudomonas chlororaphis]|nr:hypothetical protein [Pseudomonas chlororaphis]